MNTNANNSSQENVEAAAQAASKHAPFFTDIKLVNKGFFTKKKIAIGLGAIAGAAAAWYFRDLIKGAVVGAAEVAADTATDVVTEVATAV
jgi:hypothetical protein